MRTKLFPALAAIFLLLLPAGCSDDDDNTYTPVASGDLSGMWEFIISPDQVYADTTLVKGNRESDFQVYPAVTDEVYLHQSGNKLSGNMGSFKIRGSVSGMAVTLSLYDHPDGPFMADRTVEKMKEICTMDLKVGEFTALSGTGVYLPYNAYPGIVKNTVKIQAQRKQGFNGHQAGLKETGGVIAVTDWEDDICKVIFSAASWVIADLSYGVVRPMSSDCWLTKSGGGYYAFGHQGPGSVFPILTQSIYFPFEFSACQVRTYGFNISLGGQNITYTALRDFMTNAQPVQDLIGKLGFTGIPQVEQMLDDFYNQFGGFAITLFYNTNTGSSTLYVNHSLGDDNDAINSGMVQTIKGAFTAHSSDVYVYAGGSINDSQHLRRSPAFVCNSPIVICYLFGTNNVSYN